MPWSPKSPDLSPITDPGIHKKKCIENEWKNIPNEKLHNYYSSFMERCYLCRQYNGENLNGKWHEVKEIHNQYRTQLFYQTNEETGDVWIYEY